MNPVTPVAADEANTISIAKLAKYVQVGDLIFIRVAAAPFKAVAKATGTWTNHVGVVTTIEDDDPHIGESSFPLSRTTTLSRFIARSEQGCIAVARLKTAITQQQVEQIQIAVQRRHGIFYDTGFSLYSGRQFCSRYVHEVLKEATGIPIGKIETLREVVTRQPNMRLGFWRLWYLGKIPWDRKTITPASLLNSTELNIIFFGKVIIKPQRMWHAIQQKILQSAHLVRLFLTRKR